MITYMLMISHSTALTFLLFMTLIESGVNILDRTLKPLTYSIKGINQLTQPIAVPTSQDMGQKNYQSSLCSLLKIKSYISISRSSVPFKIFPGCRYGAFDRELLPNCFPGSCYDIVALTVSWT